MKRYRVTAAALAALCLLTGCTKPRISVYEQSSLSETAEQTAQPDTGTSESEQTTTTTVTAPEKQQPSDSVYMDYYYHPDLSLDEALDVVLNGDSAAESYFSELKIKFSMLMPSTNLEQLTDIYNQACFAHVEDNLIQSRDDEPYRTMYQILYDKKYKSLFGMTYDEMLEKEGSDSEEYDNRKVFADWAAKIDFHDVPIFLLEEYNRGLEWHYGDESDLDREWKKITDSLKQQDSAELSGYKDIPISIGTPIVRRMEEAIKEETEGYLYWKQFPERDHYKTEDLNEATESNIIFLINQGPREGALSGADGEFYRYPIPLPKYYELYKQKMQNAGIKIPDTIEEAYSLILTLMTTDGLKEELCDEENNGYYRWWEVSDHVQNLPKVTEVRLFIYYDKNVVPKYPYPLYACYVEGDGWVFIG